MEIHHKQCCRCLSDHCQWRYVHRFLGWLRVRHRCVNPSTTLGKLSWYITTEKALLWRQLDWHRLHSVSSRQCSVCGRGGWLHVCIKCRGGLSPLANAPWATTLLQLVVTIAL